MTIGASFLVGVIYIAPHIWFIVAEGDAYQGIPLMQTANEDFYLARMQEIVDGYPLVGSAAFYEYKDQPPLQPPTSEFIYALPTLLFGIPLTATLLASRFILPAILFLLVCFLIYRILGQSGRWPRQMSAVAGALFITLGYDLIDFRTAFLHLKGMTESASFLIWSRPVNPITGGIFLFSFLHFLWSVLENKTVKKSIIGAGIFLGLAFASYFFSWGLALSVMAAAGLYYLFHKNFEKIKSLVYVFLFGLVFSAPYWYLSFQARQSEWYENSLLRSGLFYTHFPLLNRVLIAALVIYIGYLFFERGGRFRRILSEKRDVFVVALLAGGLIAFNQQVVTGITVWPFHFVQYTIPFSIIAVTLAWHGLMCERRKALWALGIGAVIAASVWFGVFTQAKTYAGTLDRNRQIQTHRSVFDWFNAQEKDCVVAIAAEPKEFKQISGMVLAFTHCNLYANNWIFSLMPEERIYHNLLTNLRLRGVTADGLADYIKENPSTLRTYLSSNWAGLHDKRVFPDFEDLELPKRVDRFPGDYREFLNQDLEVELSKYRLDYILSVGPLSQTIIDQLPDLEFQEEINNLFIYKY